MSTQLQHTRRPQMDADPTRVLEPITVGVDGSAQNGPAIRWAAAEANRSGRPLSIVTATFAASASCVGQGFGESFNFDDHARKLVSDVVAWVKSLYPSLSVQGHVHSGDPVTVMLNAAGSSGLIVVGKRGLGAFKRVLVGSTCIAVVGRSTAPVVVVPDTWEESLHLAQPILVRIDADHDNDAILDFACRRASELDVPMVGLHVWDVHPALVLGDEDRSRWAKRAQAMVEEQLLPACEEFPDIEVRAMQRNATPALGLLDALEGGQLLVLGRRSSDLRLSGLPFGSVTRAVLHYAEQPVAVVPSRREPRDSHLRTVMGHGPTNIPPREEGP
jgi:nucleotide-binding universal stress UspA family protein